MVQVSGDHATRIHNEEQRNHSPAQGIRHTHARTYNRHLLRKHRESFSSTETRHTHVLWRTESLFHSTEHSNTHLPRKHRYSFYSTKDTIHTRTYTPTTVTSGAFSRAFQKAVRRGVSRLTMSTRYTLSLTAACRSPSRVRDSELSVGRLCGCKRIGHSSVRCCDLLLVKHTIRCLSRARTHTHTHTHTQRTIQSVDREAKIRGKRTRSRTPH